MSQTPVHVHMIRLVKHITETPLSIPLSVGGKGSREKRHALIGRKRKLERRKKKRQQLLESIQRGMKKGEGEGQES
ncbi:hypothetical protein MRY87_09935 [bacterium]|nr:hypothetical protein [bacterium]